MVLIQFMIDLIWNLKEEKRVENGAANMDVESEYLMIEHDVIIKSIAELLKVS